MEESVERFIAQFKPYAATVQLLSKVEGSPLLECVAGHTVLHLFERTNPYASKIGKAQVILNPTTGHLQVSESSEKSVQVTAISRIKAQGVVLDVDHNTIVVDAGMPLVVSLLDNQVVNLGDYVNFESEAPIHGFIVPREEKHTYRRGEIDNEI